MSNSPFGERGRNRGAASSTAERGEPRRYEALPGPTGKANRAQAGREARQAGSPSSQAAGLNAETDDAGGFNYQRAAIGGGIAATALLGGVLVHNMLRRRNAKTASWLGDQVSAAGEGARRTGRRARLMGRKANRWIGEQASAVGEGARVVGGKVKGLMPTSRAGRLSALIGGGGALAGGAGYLATRGGSEPEPEADGLSTGQIAGIGAAGVAGLYGLYRLLRKRQQD
jgi:hypothetical protein